MEETTSIRITRSIGILLLSLFLILWGALPLLRFSFKSEDIVLEIPAIVAGVLLLLGRYPAGLASAQGFGRLD